jgi:hypothetical protein
MSRSNRPGVALHPDLIALDQAHIRTMQRIAAEMDAISQAVNLTDEERTAQLAVLEQRLAEHWEQFHVQWRQLEQRLAAEEARAKAPEDVGSSSDCVEDGRW